MKQCMAKSHVRRPCVLRRGNPLTGHAGCHPRIGRIEATPHVGRVGGTPCASHAGVALLTWPPGWHPVRAGFVPHGHRLPSVSCIGAILHGDCVGASRTRGRMGFVPCMAMQVPSCMMAAWAVRKYVNAWVLSHAWPRMYRVTWWPHGHFMSTWTHGIFPMRGHVVPKAIIFLMDFVLPFRSVSRCC
ncbi:hypothetical protein TorRG33x02_151430 [Trema orientale]|uniref:Uncharacterized protein n=1 Tax=Trema orientale TaxID=63057 RepID=A0A2P5EU43_TREOI|nr:hypothetical protein TorRG33x02_151430 [Trema orientale]